MIFGKWSTKRENLAASDADSWLLQENMEKKKKITPKERHLIDEMLFHKAVKDAWLCELLYGCKTSTQTAIFSNKKMNVRGYSFTDTELCKLLEIRQNFWHPEKLVEEIQ